LSSAPETPSHETPSKPLHPIIGRALAAFHYRDFRVLWFGAFTSTVGNWMQQVAQSWLVFELTKSSFYLGLDYFCGQLPILLLSLVGGVVADRHDRRFVLLGSQLVQMTTAFTLAGLILLGHVRVQYILALSFVAGLGQAFGGPAYQALIPSLVQKKDLPNAIALNSIQFNLARVFGPLLAGVTLAAWGSAACFGLNGLSFLVVIGALLSMTITYVKPAERKPMLQEMKGGMRYVRGEPAIVALTILGGVTTFLGLPLLTFLPVFAKDIFHSDINRYSHMMAFSGAGAVCGALVTAWLGRFPHMGRALLTTLAGFGVFVTAFALCRIGWLSDALLFCTGATLLMTFAMTSSLVQLIVHDHLRGRVMSIYMVAFRGGMPLGSLVAGFIAERTSAPAVLEVNGMLILALAIYYFMKRDGVREL
jgi:MFS family permease